MNSIFKYASAAALSIFWLITPALADSTEQCLQLYYMKSYSQALPFCAQSAKKGDSQSQYVLGLMYHRGLGVKKNKAAAIKWLRAAAEQAHAAAHFKLSILENESNASDALIARYMDKYKPGTPSTATTTVKLKPVMPVQQAAKLVQHPSPDLGNSAPRITKTRQPIIHTAKTIEPKTIGSTARRSAKLVHRPVIHAPKTIAPTAASRADSFALPSMRTKKAAPTVIHSRHDHALFRQYLTASKHGDAHARFMLGLLYLEGRGVDRNEGRATNQFKLAAKQGLAQAQFCMGLIYYEGRGGILKNGKKAKHWLTKAAMQGLADAQYSLGQIYASDKSDEKNQAEAINWWRKAAAQKHPKALHNLAVTYLQGVAVKADRDKAMQWLRSEAEQGDPQTQFNLARLYSEGKWLNPSGADAAKWFYRSGEAWVAMGQPDKARKAVGEIRQLVSKRHLNVPNLFVADVLSTKIEESDH